MFKANTGYSTGASAFDAGKEAAAQAVEGLDAPQGGIRLLQLRL